MELMLWRHAEAVGAALGQPDLKRTLTKHGKDQARRMADWIRAHAPGDLRILASPAERCQQTAGALALPYEVEPKLGTGADAADLLAAAGWPDRPEQAGGSVLLVGHQPTLGQLAAWLLTGVEDAWNVKKGALWWFSTRVREDGTHTALRAVINTDLL